MKFLKKYISLMLFIFVFVSTNISLSFALDLTQDAKTYRDLGLQAQSSGDANLAMTYYQKAIELDPYFTTAYNDLGVIYEAKGMYDRAESVYMKAIEIDPACLSAYSNMASIYERKGEYEQAAYYLKLRIKLGNPADPWTYKAQERLYKIAEVCPSVKQELVEQESLALTADLIKQKQVEAVQEKTHQKNTLMHAKALYYKGDYVPAFNELVKVMEVDPYNQEAQDLLRATQKKLLM
ncbi:MAG: tetratricopeptide repeat protein [Candidatus Omnitrophota bacterium]